jgi:putative phage-type endonuclease
VSGLGVALTLRQRSPEWLLARRSLITGTDIPVLLGISPWKCEADLADEKANGTQVESTLRMRVGSALEDLILAEYAAMTGRRCRRYRAMVRHPQHEWAAASPDAGVIGERRLSS